MRANIHFGATFLLKEPASSRKKHQVVDLNPDSPAVEALHTALAKEDVFIVRAYEPEPRAYLLTNTGGHKTAQHAAALFHETLTGSDPEREHLEGTAYLQSIHEAWVNRLDEAGLLGENPFRIILEHDARKNEIKNLVAIKAMLRPDADDVNELEIPYSASPTDIRAVKQALKPPPFQGMLWSPPKVKAEEPTSKVGT